MQFLKTKFFRLLRESTDSMITVELKKAVSPDEADDLFNKTMPGWEIVSSSVIDCDEDLP